MAPRGVLLDAMGTLVAIDPPAPLLADELEARCGMRPAPAEAEAAMRAEIAHYRANMARGTAEGLAELWRDCARELRAALPVAFRSLALDEVEAAMRRSLRFRAQADAAAALRELRSAGRTLVVCSNWDAGLPDVLARCGLLELVDAVVASAAAGAAKPERAIFAAALEAAGARPGEALHVGDSLAADVEGARGAGIAAVWLRRDTAVEPPDGVPAIASLAELPALVDAYPGRPVRP